jgi:YVTN family beta-propeller protein
MNIIKGVTLTFRSIATMACLISVGLAALPASVYAKPSRSTNIALTQNGQKLVAVNVDANSVTVFQVQGGGGSLSLLAEIPVGREPHCVAVKGNNRAYVTNAQSGSVWVINLNNLKVGKKIPVGTEPRGCALTPSGSRLYVANHTAGTVSVIDTSSRHLIETGDRHHRGGRQSDGDCHQRQGGIG